MLRHRLPLMTLLAVLIVTLATYGAPAQAAKPAPLGTQVARLLSVDTTLSTKSATAHCLSSQAKQALRTTKTPDPGRIARACTVERVAVSRQVKTTAPTATRAAIKATAETAAGLLRRKTNFAEALTKHAHLGVASKTRNGHLVVFALTSTDPIKVDPTLSGGNQAPQPHATGRLDYRSGDLTVVLDGTQSSDDQAVVSYEWHTMGTASKVHIGSGPTLTWTAPTHATYAFYLTVTDAQGATRTSSAVGLNVWRWVTRNDFNYAVKDSLNSLRKEQYALPALNENSCLNAAAQKQADALSDLHTGVPAVDTATITTACKRTVRGTYTDTDEHDYNLRVRVFSSETAMNALADPATTTYGLGFAHSKDGPGYYVVFITAS